ncbi:MAG: anti-CBASS Acb1 family protein, partial [bacterium]
KVVTNSFSGLADVMRENRIGIACATRIPFSKLFGTTAAGGLANAAQDDLENYNGMIESVIREPSKQIIRKVLRLAMFACFGREYDITFKFKPLRVMTAKEEEELKSSKQTRYVNLYDKRLLDSKEIGELLHKDQLVPIETKAQQGKLPLNPEVPTAEDMFAGKKDPGGESDDQGKQDDAAAGAGDEKPAADA